MRINNLPPLVSKHRVSFEEVEGLHYPYVIRISFKLVWHRLEMCMPGKHFSEQVQVKQGMQKRVDRFSVLKPNPFHLFCFISSTLLVKFLLGEYF